MVATVREDSAAAAAGKEGRSSSFSSFLFRSCVRLAVLACGGAGLALLWYEGIELEGLRASAALAKAAGGRRDQCSSKMMEDILHSAEEFELAARKFGTPEDNQAHSANALPHLRTGQ